MGHGDGQLFLIGQLLQLFLPQPVVGSDGPATLGGDQNLPPVGIELLPKEVPPSPDTLHGKLGRFMINAHIDKSAFVYQIVDPVGHRFAVGKGDRRHTHSRRSLLLLPATLAPSS